MIEYPPARRAAPHGSASLMSFVSMDAAWIAGTLLCVPRRRMALAGRPAVPSPMWLFFVEEKGSALG